MSIRCIIGLHSWSGRTCCKCGKNKTSSVQNSDDASSYSFPLDLYNRGARCFNAGDYATAEDYFRKAYTSAFDSKPLRYFIAGGIAISANIKKRDRFNLCQNLVEEIPLDLPSSGGNVIAAFILVNMVRELNHKIEFLLLKCDVKQGCVETEFDFGGHLYGCQISTKHDAYNGILWRNETSGKVIIPKINANSVNTKISDISILRALNAWLVLKPELPVFPVNFTLSHEILEP